MFYTYILRSISQPEQRYIGSTEDLKSGLAIRRFFLFAKISGVKRSGLTAEKTNVQKPGEVLSGGGAALFLEFGCNFPKYHAFSLPLFELFGGVWEPSDILQRSGRDWRSAIWFPPVHALEL